MSIINVIKTYYKLVFWVIVIGILCFTPGNDIEKIKIPIPHFDKIVHFMMFYILGLLLMGKKYTLSESAIRWLFLSAIIYGGAIELIQYNWIYMRSGDWVDWMFDLIGLVISWKTFNYYPVILQRVLK